MSRAHIVIFGLGLMGGSLALALRGRCRHLSGVDPDAETLHLAASAGAADTLVTVPQDLPSPADLVVLAAPVRTILTLLKNLPSTIPGRAVVIDLGSTKQAVLQAMQHLPRRFDPIGGHPICGKEKGTFAEAAASLYRGAPFTLTPLPRTTHRARAVAAGLCQAIGAAPLWMDAGQHDRLLAATSHLPYLIANALAAGTPPDAGDMVGPGFRSTSRVGATPPAMMLDILLTNRENILAALNCFRSGLNLLEESLVQEDGPRLLAALEQGRSRQQHLTQSHGELNP